ncbi:hypothetical protein FQA47_001513 [Oryzias melastigma]|uniref:Uncharacterized protein n=1 Tax=Oryzias melastigma TaxID=30732 RepID=A0A834FRE0_ORYME|nr:hypothetical protein FQA47_001513 [Oryzias melastigma]
MYCRPSESCLLSGGSISKFAQTGPATCDGLYIRTRPRMKAGSQLSNSKTTDERVRGVSGGGSTNSVT